jgi:subtilase family serine protease
VRESIRPRTPLRSTRFVRPLLAAALVAGTALVALTAGPVSASTTDTPTATTAPDTVAVDACGTAAPGYVRCLAKVSRGDRHKSAATDTPDGSTGLPTGMGPADLQSAYDLTSAVRSGAGRGETVAVVDGNDDPTAEADLAVYRSTYGLPACTTANGCFRKVNQRGQAAPLPPVDGSWSIEISLDLQAVSAACPACRILLVEGDSASISDVGAGVNTAVALGANAVSNSYSAVESEALSLAADYDHPGVAITASSGDNGYQMESAPFPADLATVIAVGGTTLTRSGGRRGWSETAWAANAKGNAAGSACSPYVDKPSWQHDKACPGRTIADVSADADPQSGLAVYDTTPNPDNLPAGWMVIGGTSASSPFVAAVYAMAGHTATVDNASGLYAHSNRLNDVTGGNDSVQGIGQDCPDTSYICTGRPGYDGPTGLGTPNGLGAF